MNNIKIVISKGNKIFEKSLNFSSKDLKTPIYHRRNKATLAQLIQYDTPLLYRKLYLQYTHSKGQEQFLILCGHYICQWYGLSLYTKG